MQENEEYICGYEVFMINSFQFSLKHDIHGEDAFLL